MQSNFHKANYPLGATLVALGAIFAASTALAGGSSSLKFNLSPFLAAHQLSATQLGNAFAAEMPTGTTWSSGTLGRFNPAYLAFEMATRGESAIERSLKISYNAIYSNPVSFASCGSDGTCVDLTAAASEHGYTVSHEGTQWTVDVIDLPCYSGIACEALLPSWSLEKRREAGDAPWQSFPTIASILDHRDGVTIFNAQTGAEWMTISTHEAAWPTADMGALIDVNLEMNGLLSLQFDSGMVVLDFVKDRLFAAAASGLYLAGTGLGQSSPAGWRSMNIGAGAGAPLLVTKELLVFRDRVVVWSVRADVLKKDGVEPPLVRQTPASLAFAKEINIGFDAVSVDKNEATQWRFFPASNTFTQVSTLANVAKATDVRIVDDTLEMDSEKPKEGTVASTHVNGGEVKVQVIRP